MPSLKQLTCHVEWAISNIPFDEYLTTYGDGVVQCYLAIPPTPTSFSISVESEGSIAPGLAVIVFIDGVYQCNRNRCRLDLPENVASSNTIVTGCSVQFRLRQQEEYLTSGKWIAREWMFKSGVTTASSSPDRSINSTEQSWQHSSIDVYVLRCHNFHTDEDDEEDFELDSEMFPSYPGSPESGTCPLRQLSDVLPTESYEPSFQTLYRTSNIAEEGRNYQSVRLFDVPNNDRSGLELQSCQGLNQSVPRLRRQQVASSNSPLKSSGVTPVNDCNASRKQLVHYLNDGSGNVENELSRLLDREVDHDFSPSVGHGEPEQYVHTIRKPKYLDDLKKPYAHFVFKYRAQDTVERVLKIRAHYDPVKRKKHLKTLTKVELVENLLQSEKLLRHRSASLSGDTSQGDGHALEKPKHGDSINSHDSRHENKTSRSSEIPHEWEMAQTSNNGETDSADASTSHQAAPSGWEEPDGGFQSNGGTAASKPGGSPAETGKHGDAGW